MDMNILFTSAGRRGYLVRYFKEALREAGLKGLVHAGNSQESPAFAAADKTVVTPLIYDPGYIDFLLDYCRRWEIRLLIPLIDIDLPVLAARKAEFLKAGTRVVAAEPWAARACNDKWMTWQLLQKEGLKAPKTWLDASQALEAVKSGEAAWPLMVKPRWGMGSLSVYEAENEQELFMLTEKIRREIGRSYLKYEAAADMASCVLIQQKLKGREFGLDIMNDLEGHHMAVSVKEKLAMRSGETDRAVTVDCPALKEIGARLGRSLKQPGNLDADVFLAEGEYYVLELNARFGGGYPFSHAAGVNLPLAIVRWAAGLPVSKELLAARPGVMAQKDIQLLVWEQAGWKEE